MAFRTISLAEDAYDALAALRGPGESFTDVVRRLTQKRSMKDLGKVMSKASAEALASAIEENRRDRRRLRESRGVR